MKTATFQRYKLIFKQPGGTSRGVLTTKETYFLQISEDHKSGFGECAVFRGLSYDDVPEYERTLAWLCDNINQDPETLRFELRNFPSIWFGYEQALLNLIHSDDLYFPSEFSQGKSEIKINGLIWMGKADFMQNQIQDKLNKGFDCIKLKIGVDWQTEKEILRRLRRQFVKKDLEIRVDANGGFTFGQAKTVLQELAELDIHSIEQPIKSGNPAEMAILCSTTPTPIALDEELIGVLQNQEKRQLLSDIRPQYIILKPSLVGGISGTDEWITLAEQQKTGWWITSALESNIGLNAIAQYTFTKSPTIPQGLGTGGLFTNNTETRLELEGDRLRMKTRSVTVD